MTTTTANGEGARRGVLVTLERLGSSFAYRFNQYGIRIVSTLERFSVPWSEW